ncbi:MAG: alpha/beta hydrolase [Firmicutes bacterium]|nr:alpha/beta hydrolase [Bacillota bacterium]
MLVLLHGGGIDSGQISYGTVLPRLARTHRVVVPDLPGFGDTPGDHRVSTVDAYVTSVISLISELGLNSVCLGGLSLGGGIALGIALHKPAWLRKLVLVAPYGLTDRIPYRRLTSFLVRHPQFSIRLGNWSVSRPRRAQWSLRGLLANKAALTPDLVSLVVAEAKRPEAGRAWQAIQRSEVTAQGLKTCYRNHLSAIEIPTLILVGAQDHLVSPEDCRQASQLMPHASLQIFERCSHWVPRDQPDLFVTAVEAFLDAD